VDQALHKMKIIARTVMSHWTIGMVTRFARSASMTHVKQDSNGVYASGGRQLTASHHPKEFYVQAHRSFPSAGIAQ
jgi:hypothetical protein